MSDAATLPPAVLGQAIVGGNLRGPTLAEHLGERRAVVAFLRHFG